MKMCKKLPILKYLLKVSNNGIINNKKIHTNMIHITFLI